MEFGTAPMRPGFDRNSKDSKLFVKFSQFEMGILSGFWSGEKKQLKNESVLRCSSMNK